jgi:hypothetical protein
MLSRTNLIQEKEMIKGYKQRKRQIGAFAVYKKVLLND